MEQTRQKRGKRSGELSADWKPSPARGGPASGAGRGGPARYPRRAATTKAPAVETAPTVASVAADRQDASLTAPAHARAIAASGEAWSPGWREPRGPMPILRAAAPAVAAELARLATAAESESVRVSAATQVLDRVLGKPTQSVVSLTASLDAPPDALSAVRAALLGDLGDPDPDPS